MAERVGAASDPCVMVIFGASGDLTKRKLIPALHNLAKDGLLAEQFAVVGVSRSEMTHEEFREKLTREVQEFSPGEVDPKIWDWLVERLYYSPGDVQLEGSFERLAAVLGEVNERHNAGGNYLYYLATAPRFFAPTVDQLGQSGLSMEEGDTWRRVIFEKPFGSDYESAKALNRDIQRVLDEKQIYRIDHYLGKETVQNILVFRFANGIFEPLWNHRYIDHVQITVAESLGVEDRGGYYDKSGAMRDMVPNHIFQLISLTTMEPPVSFEADAVRDEQAKALRSLTPLAPEEVLQTTVRGQYGEGTVSGRPALGYRQENGVPDDSTTETFVAMKMTLDNWRWAGVPIYLRTGKRMPSRATEIVIQFRAAPFMLFRKTDVSRLPPSRLILRLQPDEGISLSFGAKVPGPVVQLDDVNMDFKYKDHFGATPSTGYERLLYDCMLGDATLFQRADMTETSWKIVAPIMDVWKALPPRDFPNYPRGLGGRRARMSCCPGTVGDGSAAGSADPPRPPAYQRRC
jgi:glucose-6-phosphate 1-dehydrogenase